MNLLVAFSRTGCVGPLHCGMPLAEAEGILGQGRPHPAIRMMGSDIDGYPYSWGDLDLVVTRRSVSGIWIRLQAGSVAELPAIVLPDSNSHSATVRRDELIAALDAAECEHAIEPNLTFGRQSSIRTRPADVCAVFFPRDKESHVPGGLCLGVIHKHVA